jgi:hypothetical protein
MTFPDDSIQSILDSNISWWEKTESKSIERGFLVKAFLPHVDQVPYTVIPKARKNPKCHDRAYVQIRELDIKHPRTREDLPVAAMSLNDKEIWAAYRAKKRLCLVMAVTRQKVNPADRRHMPKSSTAQTLLVVPYYGADQDGTRAGWNPKLVELVRHIVYPQFYVDMLPLNGPLESIGRFDQLQPIGRMYNSYETTGYKLSSKALNVVDELFHNYLYGLVKKGSDLYAFIELIKESFYS